MKKAFLLSIIILSSLYIYSQTTINLVNGKKIPIHDYKISNSEYIENEGEVFYTKLSGQRRSLEFDEIFSIDFGNGKDTVLYRPDLEYGEYLSVEQMRSYVKGLSIARENYKSYTTFGLGLVAGAGGAFLPQLEITTEESNITTKPGLALPIAYTLIAGNSTIKTENIPDRFTVSTDDEYLVQGIKEGVRKKRLRNSAAGSIIGTGAAFLILFFISK